MRILFFILSIFIYGNSWAWLPLAHHKVRIHLKDGSLKTGFVIGESMPDEKFDPNVFLKECLNRKPKFRKFEIYSQIYSINDNGKIGGIAVMKEEEVEVFGGDVKNIDLLKSVHEDDERKDVPVFSRNIINVMKKKLVFADEISSEGGSWEYVALNYNPKVPKNKLHQLLLRYMKGISGTKEASSYNEVMNPDGIVFIASYSD